MQNSAKLNKAPIRASLTRPRLLLGADRNYALALIAISVFFFIGQRPWWSYLLGITLLTFGMPVLRKIAKADPLMIPVWKKYLYRPDFLPAVKSIYAPYRVPKRKNKRS